jgi:hypothetical protein
VDDVIAFVVDRASYFIVLLLHLQNLVAGFLIHLLNLYCIKL